MYAETGLLFPCFQNFSPETQHFDYSYKPQKANPCLNTLAQSTISEYDLGAEGDLFKAPEPIIEEPVMELDPVTAAIAMINCGEDVISPQELKVAGIESIQGQPLLSEVFYECRKDLLAKAAIDIPSSEVLDIKIPLMPIDENDCQEKLPSDIFQKSISSGCLSSMEWKHGSVLTPSFMEFSAVDFGAVYGMRRAFSEGDIKALGSGSTSCPHSAIQPPPIVSNCTAAERKEKLSRYRNKKTKRNFRRKIKYACRKALADSQPRIRGRFARTEETDYSKKQ